MSRLSSFTESVNEGIPVFYEGDEEIINARMINVLNNNVKIAEFTCVFFAMLGIGTSIMDYELEHDRDLVPEETESHRQMLLWVGVLCTLILYAMIALRYKIHLELLIAKTMLTKYDTLSNTGHLKKMFYEFAICTLFPMPYLNNVYYSKAFTDWDAVVEYSVNDILLTLSMLRIYLLLRFLLQISDYMSTRS